MHIIRALLILLISPIGWLFHELDFALMRLSLALMDDEMREAFRANLEELYDEQR